MEIDYTLILGIIGASFTLFGFMMIQLDKWTSSSIGYDLANFISGTTLSIYSYLIGSAPFIIINFVWALFSLKGIIEYFLRK